MAIDVVTLGIMGARLDAVCRMMEFRLFHSAYSTILRESHDGSAAVCTLDGNVVSVSGAPLHVATYARSVAALVAARNVATMSDGDAYVSTDPYFGGSLHVPDLVVMMPVFVGSRPVCFVASCAHKPDVGGIVPGSSGANAREIFHDGLLLRAVRYATSAGIDPDIEGVVRSNSRSPETVAGDIRAQVGGCRLGAQLLSAMCAEYGTGQVTESLSEIQDRSEAEMRHELSGWPDGESSAESQLDDDGVQLDVPVPIRVTVRKRGSSLTIDLSASAAQVEAPISLRPQAVEAAAAMSTINMVDPSIRINSGIVRPIQIVNPEGLVTHARWPKAVNSYFGTTLVLYSTMLRALAGLNPKRAVGSIGLGQGALALGYASGPAAERRVHYEVLGSSLGGHPNGDGSNVVQGMQHNTPNTPIEVLESEFPIRVLRHEWITDSAGAGAFRGGLGYIKEYEVLEDALLTLRLGNSFGSAGWGVAEGRPGARAAAFVIGADSETPLRPLQTVNLKRGDRLRLHMAGGGGYGDPRQRDRDLVIADLRDGYISAAAAADVYGLDPQAVAEATAGAPS